jgi:nitroreductase
MSSQEKLSMSVGEAMFTQRSIRRIKPDPIPVQDMKTFLEAAVKAPNGGNAQPARFVVVNDSAKIEALGELYLEAWWAKRRDIQGWHSIEDIPPSETIYLSATRFAEAFGKVPLVVLPTAPKGTPSNSVLPWLQNMMLAARALGIGSVLTTLHPQVEARTAKLFSIPQDVEIFGCVPMGYPRGNFGPTRRKPISELAYFNDWGGAAPWPESDTASGD